MSSLVRTGGRGRWLALVCLGVPFSIAAQTPAALDTIVVTATRSDQRLADTLPHTTIITRADIERAQGVDLLDLLATQAGVEVARSGGFGAQSSLFLRGTNSSQTLVLVDGIRLNTAVGGAAALGGIGLDGIERIEIARGNLSSLYGSEAIGGVIQIFTRGGGAPSASARVEGGAGRTRAGSVAANTRWATDLGATEFAVAGGYRDAKPFSAIETTRVVVGPFAPGANPDLDENRNRNGSLRVKQALGARAEVGASVWTSRNDTDFDSTADGPTATHREVSHQDVWEANTKVMPLANWTTRLRVGEGRDKSRNVVSDPASFNNGEFQARNRQVAWDNAVAVVPTVEAQLGLEQLQQHGASTSYDPNFTNALVSFDRRVRAVWVGATAQPDVHWLQVNLRHDDYSDVGGATTGLAAYAYQVLPAARLGAQYSTAFRAPSFNDLYFPFFGNPRLAPERARSVEGNVRYVAGDTTLRFALYHTRTRDLIVFDAVSGTAQNIARAKIDGAELALATRLADWRIDLTVDASRPVDEATGQRLLRRAPWRATLGTGRAIGAAEIGVAVTHVAARYDSDINTFERSRLDPYTVLRATFAYRVGTHVRLTLRVENLSDERYELVSGYNTPGRGAFVGVEARI
jgi:vitamin B12 transporter